MATELEMLLSCTDLIADAVVRKLYPVQDDLSTNEAYKAYGRAWVEKAVREKKIRQSFVGQKVIYSRTELDALRLLERQPARIITSNTRNHGIH